MAEYNFQSRGWHALAAVAVSLGYFGLQVAVRIYPVDYGMRNAIRERLLNDYSGRSLRDLARLVAEARPGVPVEHVPEVVQHDIQFTSIAAHGRMGGSVIGNHCGRRSTSRQPLGPLFSCHTQSL